MQLKDKVINVLGDSITQGAAASEPSKCYVELVATRTQVKRVNNYGIGGTRIARKTIPSECTLYDVDYICRSEVMDKSADLIVVFGGTNDYGHGDAPLGTIEDCTEYTFYGACRVLFEKIRKLYSTAQIAVITPMRRVNDEEPYGEFGNKKEKSATLREYRDALKAVAEVFGVPVLDMFEDQELNPTNEEKNKKYFADGLHPNDEGHSLLADKIIAFLKEI